MHVYIVNYTIIEGRNKLQKSNKIKLCIYPFIVYGTSKRNDGFILEYAISS